MKSSLALNGRGRDKTKGLRPSPQRTQNNTPLLGARTALSEACGLIEQSFDIYHNTAILRALFGVPDPARIEAVGGVI